MIEDMEAKHFQAGESIFLEGEEAGTVYLIDKGKVEISKNSSGQRVVLDELGWNDIFGEMALINNNPRSATATAIEDSWVYMLKKEVFQNSINSLHPFMKAIFSSLVNTAKTTTEQQIQHVSNRS